METTHYYIVSFGDSRLYRYSSAARRPFDKYEIALESALRAKFPTVDTFAYYTTPRVTEVTRNSYDEHTEIPVLDEHAIYDIQCVLAGEVRNQEFQQTLDDNAPWSNI